jgi:hypothetical protein
VPDDWFDGFQVGLEAQFWRAASEPWADEGAAAIAGLLDLPRDLDVTGIDISPEEIEAARARRSKATFEVGDLRELPRAPSMPSFNGATASATCPIRRRSRHCARPDGP